MNARQRHIATLLFDQPDRIPLQPGGGRKSTRENWYAQGLPRDVKDITQYAYRQVGGTLDWPLSGPGFRCHQIMMPQFEEKVIERKKDSQIVQDWKGNVCEISNEFTTEYLRSAIDFVTRRWVKCPVENRVDWEDMKRRYNAEDPARLPENPHAAGLALRERTHPVIISLNGPFWQLREWLGFEQLCMLLHDDRDFAVEMIKFWEDFVARLLERTFEHFIPDEIHLSEDMAYKSFSMISPKMTRELLLPTYVRWGEIIRKAGVPLYGMDSDGFIGELIPIWIDAGINACDPIEVAAGNDIVAFRKQFGRRMAYRGGVDKRAMAKGGAALAQEIGRIAPVVADGGYIPACDHGIPHDVSWQNYLETVRRLALITGWL